MTTHDHLDPIEEMAKLRRHADKVLAEANEVEGVANAAAEEAERLRDKLVSRGYRVVESQDDMIADLEGQLRTRRATLDDDVRSAEAALAAVKEEAGL